MENNGRSLQALLLRKLILTCPPAIVSQYATNYGHGASSLPSGLATPTSQVTTAAPEGSVSESVYSQQSLHESTHQPKVKYLGIHPTLRPGAASGCPHIIDLSSIDPSIQQGGLDFADLAATVLYNYDAAVLTSFLDLGKKKFDFRRTDSKTDGGLFFIERRVKFVTVGVHPPCPECCNGLC